MTPAERILAKALAASPMKSADWSSIQAGLRDRAFFSATVDDARRLAVMREAVAKVASGDLSESQARLEIREALEQTGYTPPQDKKGGLQDLSSQRRLDLIIQTNVAEARGYVRYLEGTSEGALAAFPCQELVRVQGRKAPRNWPEIWKGHGGQIYGGRMIALKTDEIWTAISRFGHPWPPFDFGSGMGVRDVGRREAIRYGVIAADDPPPKMPPEKRPNFNENLADRLPKGREKETDLMLREAFGAQVSIEGDMAKWNGSLIRDMLAGGGTPRARLGRASGALIARIEDEDIRSLAEKNGLTIPRQWMQTHALKHEKPSGKGGANLPLSTGDFELIPSLWRCPDSATRHGDGELELSLETLDGGILTLGVNLSKGTPTTFHKRKTRAPSHSPKG